MIRVHQVKTTSSEPAQIKAALLRKLNMPLEDLIDWHIYRRSVDARKHTVTFSYTIDAKVHHEKKYLKNKDVIRKPNENYHFSPAGTIELANRPVVIGFGPAGMFAALVLSQEGYRPLIIERGSSLRKRQQDVDRFWKEGILDPESNVQFGEGGAGAFSDGKLTSRTKDVLLRKVLEELVHYGADPDILIDAYPHIGSDAFVSIIENMREDMKKMGAEFLFDTRLEDVVVEEDDLKALIANQKEMDCQACILAIGHSAADTVHVLHERGMELIAKPFPIGVRIEHTQDFINEAMLGEFKNDPRLVPARYTLTTIASNGKGVYTFCMCPGGYVIPSAAQSGQLVVNGMSYADRAGTNANSALLVQCGPSDYGNELFSGENFVQDLEKKAYHMTTGFKVPVQLAADYLNNTVSTKLNGVTPSYALGYEFADLNDLFPSAINKALHEALIDFEKKVPGFVSSGSVLSAVESRSNPTVRMVRDKETRMSSIRGLYPCGEGSGYAGGIVTSAIDGIKSAHALMNTFKKGVY
ncbi:NAD(P)/FAD-dependent oxidoreductase [uncultured Dubosiella sp.]|uniref:NAD(P)/FAD-dependent oxidoreductase n=1 Tax=uncultured Dubosiella sp. TaxID=1937011 RepID=UPI002611D259|nr:hypothetical protein [uncultured Dubosiella sp.]